MIDSIKAIRRSEFFKNVFALFTGNAIAQGITLVSIPILTRLYTPEEFGIVALYIGIINVIAVASNGRYDMAIVLPKKNGEAFHMLIGSILLSGVFSFFAY